MKDEKVKEVVRSILFSHIDPTKYSLLLFGSRATGSARKWSDYDIGVLGSKPLSLKTQALVAEELENSDIPYVVEVVDLLTVSDTFRSGALRGAKQW